MKVTLIQIKTPDHLDLPGILYEPEKKTNKVLVRLHGNGSTSVFYSQNKLADLARKLTDKGISLLAFNNRGAHYIKSFSWIDARGVEHRKLQGTAYEFIKDCIIDIDSVIEYLHGLKYREISLIGESTGANKICVYNYYKKKNLISKYILAAGGDDTGLYYHTLGRKQFENLLSLSLKKINAKKGKDLVLPDKLSGMIMSYQSLYDTINPDGDYNTFPFYESITKLDLSRKELFREFKSITKETLVIYGNNDEFCLEGVTKSMDLLRANCSAAKNFTYKTVRGADHGFYPKEKIYHNNIVNWLNNN